MIRGGGIIIIIIRHLLTPVLYSIALIYWDEGVYIGYSESCRLLIYLLKITNKLVHIRNPSIMEIWNMRTNAEPWGVNTID